MGQRAPLVGQAAARRPRGGRKGRRRHRDRALVAPRRDRLAALAAVAVDGERFQPQPPPVEQDLLDRLDRRLVRQVDGLADPARDERLQRRQHAQVAARGDAAAAGARRKGRVEDREVRGSEPRRTLERAVRLGVADQGPRLGFAVAEAGEGERQGAVDESQAPAADELLALHERELGLDAGGVAVHRQRDRAGGREAGDLRVAEAVLAPQGDRLGPALEHRRAEGRRQQRRVDRRGRRRVGGDHAPHRGGVLGVAGEGPAGGREPRRLPVGGARHQRGDAGGEGARGLGVVRQAAGHEQAPEVGEAEAERAEAPRGLGDCRRRIAGVVDEDLLRRDQHLAGVREAGGIEARRRRPEAHQVQRREVAGALVEEQELAAGVAGADRARGGAGVPARDGVRVLDARVAAAPGRLGKGPPQLAGAVARPRGAVGDPPRRPLAVRVDEVQERVAHAQRVVGVLEGHRPVGAAGRVEARVVPGGDERTRLGLFDQLGAHEIEHVRVLDVEQHHARRAARLAAALDGSREGVEAAHERERPRGGAAARERLHRAAQAREVAAAARAVLEEHPLRPRQREDRLERVVHRVDEACRALRPRLDADVEPHGRVEGCGLVHQQPGELVGEGGGVLLAREETVLARPARDRAHDADEHRADAAFARRGAEAAAEVLRRDHLDGGVGPGGRSLHAVLPKELAAPRVAEDDVAPVPGHALERIDAGSGPAAGHGEAGGAAGRSGEGRREVEHRVILLQGWGWRP